MANLVEVIEENKLYGVVSLLTNHGRMTYTEILEADVRWIMGFISHTERRLEEERKRIPTTPRR